MPPRTKTIAVNGIYRGRAVPRVRIKNLPRPNQVTKLPMAGTAVIHAMVHGPFQDVEVVHDGPSPPKLIKAFEPMTFMDACRMLGLDPRPVLALTRLKKFTEEMMRQLTARRCLEQARNLGVAIGIRDSESDGSPQSMDVKLRAISSIDRAFDREHAKANIQINNNVQTLDGSGAKPGYVIRLSPAKVIEHDKSEVK